MHFYKKWTENLWLLGIIPLGIYFFILWKYSQNIPHWDDYAIINFVNKFHATDDFFEKIKLIFAQHNEHRIAFTRIIALIITQINGSLNFQWMIVFGNLALVGILIVMVKFLKRNQLSINYIIPICFLIFKLSIYENSLWGMASVQNFWVILFVFLSIWQIADDKLPYLWAFLAAFTSANGVVFVPLIGVIIFALKSQKTLLLKWLLFSAILLLVYFVSYSKLPDSQPISLNFSSIGKSGLTLIGSLADFNIYQIFSIRTTLAMSLGLVLIIFIFSGILFKYLSELQLFHKNTTSFYFLIGAIIFILGTAFATAISRNQYGIYVFLTSKYKIYSILMACILYFLLLVNFKYFGKNIVFIIALLLGIYISLGSYFYSLAEIKNYFKSENASYFNGWHKNGKLEIADENSCYKYKNTFLDRPIFELPKLKEQKLGLVIIKDSTINIVNTEFEIIGSQPEAGAYLEFVSGDQKYIFATQQEHTNNKKAFFLRKGGIYTKGFSCSIPLTNLASGDYFINILDKTDQKLFRIPTNYYLEIEGVKAKTVNQNW